jgi:hypothetical protein
VIIFDNLRYRLGVPNESFILDTFTNVPDAFFGEFRFYKVGGDLFTNALACSSIELRMNGSDKRKDYVIDTNSLKSFEAPAVRAVAIAAPQIPALQVVSVRWIIVERNSVFWKYSTQITLKNNVNIPMKMDLELLFSDRRGFLLDTDREYNVQVGAGQSRTIAKATLVDVKYAGAVASVRAVLKK